MGVEQQRLSEKLGVTRATVGAMVQMQVPWFDAEAHPEFVSWADKARKERGLASWCAPGVSHGGNDFPDIFVGVDPSMSGEGTDSDMPDEYWRAVVDVAAQARHLANGRHIIVWIEPE